jgi:hypothetical protein
MATVKDVRLAVFLLVLTGCVLGGAGAIDARDGEPAGRPALPPRAGPFYGFTPFPYDFSAEAIERTHSVIAAHSTLFAMHFDGCVPWQEALADRAWPPHIAADWDDLARRIPRGHAVYLALAPTATDRKSLAPACGQRENAPGEIPAELRNRRLDDALVKKVFLAYARRAVLKFRPHFLNIAIEMGDTPLRYPADWPRFTAFYDHVRTALKSEFPDLKIGFSGNPQTFRDPKVASAVKPLVDRSDYLGLSFYPYAGPMGEKFGAPPLPSGPAAWRETLAWVRGFTDKPIAISETGFTTQDISLRQYSLSLRGDVATQAAYVRDLVEIARRDRYLFVVWFLAIDYDKLYAKMPKGSEVNLLWRNIGLFDGDLRPKPAWKEWKAFAAAVSPPSAGVHPGKRGTARPGPVQIGFRESGDLFACATGGRVSLEATGPKPGTSSMRWDFPYGGDWQWCANEREAGQLAGATTTTFWIRSDREGPLFVRLDEEDGESFYSIVTVRPEWQLVSLPLAGLSLDPSTTKDGKLDARRLRKLLLADPPAGGGQTGRRSIWVSEWFFK